MSTEAPAKSPGKLSLPALTAMVVGSMVGAGVFTLPQRFEGQTGVYGALIAWAIAGAGMLMLAFVFQRLAVRKPDLNNGVYVYARTGFGVYPGFLSAFGFWASACAGNTFYWVLITSTLKPLSPRSAMGTPSGPSRSRRCSCGASTCSSCAASAKPRSSTRS